MSNKFKKAFAFTLAETLIVIGVIGIVSALTLPNLNSSTGDKERVAKVKKIYQNLTDALGRAQAVYGPYDEWFVNDNCNGDGLRLCSKRMGERISEFMKVSKDCALDTGKGCFSTMDVLYLNGSKRADSYDNWADSYKILTSDSTSIKFMAEKNDIVVDIDGPTKGNNTFGKDIFFFLIEENNLKPYGDDPVVGFDKLLDNAANRGFATSTWIIRYDNADYLQIQSVSGSTATCKNGNVMTEANPRCK